MYVYSSWIDAHRYEVLQFWVPHNIWNRLKWLRKYFNIADRENIPCNFKRRKNAIEYVESAVITLARIDQCFDLDIPIALGSIYLDSKPWAIFGEAPQVEGRLNFRDFSDLSTYYHKVILSNNASSTKELFHFRIAPSLVESLAYKHCQTVNSIVVIATALLYDILLYCGPDCETIFDLFDNDLRTTKVSKKVISDWQSLRCKVMGRYGRILDKPKRYKLGQLYHNIPLQSRVKIELVSELDDIAIGERARLIKIHEPEPVLHEDPDDDSVSPEQDPEFPSKAEKYKHLMGF